MPAHLVVGGGDHSARVASRLVAGAAPHRRVLRPARETPFVDPVVTTVEGHLDHVLSALDLPAPVVADLIAAVLPSELSDLSLIHI